MSDKIIELNEKQQEQVIGGEQRNATPGVCPNGYTLCTEADCLNADCGFLVFNVFYSCGKHVTGTFGSSAENSSHLNK